MPSDSKQIAKNTLFLYMRMFLLMLVGLYTSRVNLHSLGVEGYGIYNVVAGFVVMFSALTGALGNAISRFIQVELGKGDKERLKLVFSTSLTIQIIIGLIITLLIEIIGIWFINNKMQFPDGEQTTAFWVLQFSTISFVLSLLYVPYYACIIAHEKMSAFAYISLVEAAMKLIIAFSVAYSPVNKLIVFAILLMLNQFLVRTLYIKYCQRHFEECEYHPSFDKPLIKDMFGFVGWNLFAHGASVLSVQGVNMVMNVFFGVIVNAARAIETQVNSVVQQFISNFTTALVPPITKSYVVGDKKTAFNLVYKGDRYSYYLMLFISLPIMLETDTILSIWLKTPPDYASIFVCWTLAASLAKTLGSNTIFALIMADGRIREYQIAGSLVALLPLPISWIAFRLGSGVVFAYLIYFLSQILLIIVRLFYANKITGMSVKIYMTNVVFRVIIVTASSLAIPFFLKIYLESNIYISFIIIACTLMSTSLSVLFLGMNKGERITLLNRVIKFLHKK